MTKMSEDTLEQQLSLAATKVEVGGRYQHYKGNMYIVVAVAFEEATMEIVVVYQAEYGQQLTFTRPLAIWDQAVQWKGGQVPRFQMIEK